MAGGLLLATFLVNCEPNRGSAPEEVVISSFPRHLVGLDEDVDYVVAQPIAEHVGTTKYVRRRDGSRQVPLSVEAEERSARSTRFGTLSPELYALYLKMSARETIPIVL